MSCKALCGLKLYRLPRAHQSMRQQQMPTPPQQQKQEQCRTSLLQPPHTWPFSTLTAGNCICVVLVCCSAGCTSCLGQQKLRTQLVQRLGAGRDCTNTCGAYAAAVHARSHSTCWLLPGSALEDCNCCAGSSVTGTCSAAAAAVAAVSMLRACKSAVSTWPYTALFTVSCAGSTTSPDTHCSTAPLRRCPAADAATAGSTASVAAHKLAGKAANAATACCSFSAARIPCSWAFLCASLNLHVTYCAVLA